MDNFQVTFLDKNTNQWRHEVILWGGTGAELFNFIVNNPRLIPFHAFHTLHVRQIED